VSIHREEIGGNIESRGECAGSFYLECERNPLGCFAKLEQVL
jgi:hypothetical protein